jgi:D-glycero-alpha-D-manno-heptose 1-phosphate guanylyltransferase
MVTALILAGGLGTRLASVLPHLPKTLAPIQNVPFLQLLFNQLENSKIVTQIILSLGHKADAIEEFLTKKRCSIPIDLSIEPSPLGTGGALLYTLPKITTDTLLILNGDSYFHLPLAQFLHFHETKKSDFSIACKAVENGSRYGVIEIDPTSKKILSFKEKPPKSDPAIINAGIYLIEKHLLSPLTPGHYSLEKDFFPLFLKKNSFAYLHEGSFIDIGTPTSYNEAQTILAPWILP